VHTSCFGRLVNFPAGQVSHVELGCKSWSALPSGHASHSIERSPAYVPGSHRSHSKNSPAPFGRENFPGRHALQLAASGSSLGAVPARQSSQTPSVSPQARPVAHPTQYVLRRCSHFQWAEFERLMVHTSHAYARGRSGTHAAARKEQPLSTAQASPPAAKAQASPSLSVPVHAASTGVVPISQT
jgi:hypothetical protein